MFFIKLFSMPNNNINPFPLWMRLGIQLKCWSYLKQFFVGQHHGSVFVMLCRWKCLNDLISNMSFFLDRFPCYSDGLLPPSEAWEKNDYSWICWQHARTHARTDARTHTKLEGESILTLVSQWRLYPYSQLLCHFSL